MTLTITYGWWMLPAAITVTAFVAAYLAQPRDFDPYEGIVSFGEYYWAAAIAVSCAGWLVYSMVAFLAG